MTRTPISTYRLQLTAQFALGDAAAITDYVRALGIDWVYLSPLLQSTEGSTHGYDVTDHARIDAARGGAAGLSQLSAAARRKGLGVLADIVPNHVGVADASQMAWWWSVLQEGRASAFADHFDIDWDAGGDKLIIPVLGETLEEAAAAGVLTIVSGELRYHDHRYPLAAGSFDDGADAVRVHERQHYRLVDWRRADHDLNYRRFFAVNGLAAIRVELPTVFEASHVEIVRWIREGLVDGLRVDHPDGLADPGGYLDALAAATDGAYVLVEKILESGEALPPFWATAGTTGYDALAELDRVLVDPAGRARLDALDARLRQDGGRPWAELIHDTKRGIADGILHSEVRRLARDVTHWSRLSRPSDPQEGLDQDLPKDVLEDAIAELLACFPVYRSYLPLGREHLDTALSDARRRRPELAAAFDALEPILGDADHPAAIRFQQTSGMVMAKGVEDTAFYRVSRLASLTEVGADPAEFSMTIAEFHERQQNRLATHPLSMTTLSTHDTKRGEDTRARITVIAELPEQWAAFLARRRQRHPLRDGAFENVLWESIVGSWPRDREALHAYAEKAAREAGTSTEWAEPDEEFETRMHELVDAVFDDAEVAADVDGIVTLLAAPGRSNGLALKLLQLTGPGVPDVYQGSELWERSLVDPDNRRAVDFEQRRALLAELDSGARPPVDESGAAKLLVVSRALRLRRDRPELFARYVPLPVVGAASDHLVAIDRGGAIVLATRLPVGLDARGGWGDNAVLLPAGPFVEQLTGRTFAGGETPVAELLERYPRRATRGPGGVTVIASVWAPTASRVQLVVARAVQIGERRDGFDRGEQFERRELSGGRGGWWHDDRELPLGTRYGFRLDDSDDVLYDPRGRRLPDGVHGLSEVTETPGFDVGDWAGRALGGGSAGAGVIYELHLGTFTSSDGGPGTLDSAIERLDHLVELGVDFIEPLPVNAFNGSYNWGYDGVAWYAVHEGYGGPDAYRRFVTACHSHGLGVIQDVVYNHLGPSGNVLPRFGPYLRQDAGNTWGDALNLAEPEVRRYILDNARMWFEEYGVDGLRLDAVHALVDESPTHLLAELAAETDALATQLGRPLTLIAESDLNDPVMITPREASSGDPDGDAGYGLDAQWSDDYHHAVHVALTGETDGYYADFASLGALAKAATRGFFHDGTYSSFREREHGKPIPATVPTTRLVTFAQDHDQIGNRATGDRLSATLSPQRLAIGAVLSICSPFTPMIFMGEEWGASTPWQFFTSHPEPELGAAVAEGRIAEFERMGWDPSQVPDPQDPDTFRRSQLDWSERARSPHAELLGVYRELIALRRRVPELTNPDFGALSAEWDDVAGWFVLGRGDVEVLVNLGTDPWTRSAARPELLFATARDTTRDTTVIGSARVTVPGESAAVIRLHRSTS